MTTTQAQACKADKDNLGRVEINCFVVHLNLNGGASHNKSNMQTKLARILR